MAEELTPDERTYMLVVLWLHKKAVIQDADENVDHMANAAASEIVFARDR